MKPVFTDASSAILLHKVGLFEPMSDHFSIVFSPSVYKEITQSGYPGSATFQQAEKEEKVCIMGDPDLSIVSQYPAISDMGAGEKETLCLFLKTGQGFILIDDGLAARFCTRNKLPFINALLVPKLFFHGGLMREADSLKKMDLLCKIGRYSNQIIAIAHRLTPEDLSRFLKNRKE